MQITIKELCKLCARYDEIKTRINIARMAANAPVSIGTNSRVKDNPEKIKRLEDKMSDIQAQIEQVKSVQF